MVAVRERHAFDDGVGKIHDDVNGGPVGTFTLSNLWSRQEKAGTTTLTQLTLRAHVPQGNSPN